MSKKFDKRQETLANANYDLESYRHFRLEAGQNAGDLGMITYRVLTNNGDSLGFYEVGPNREDFLTNVSGQSIEALGDEIKRPRDAAQDPIYPAKLINCKHGDAVIQCEDGDIILRADNIVFEAKGVSATNDGNITMKANKSITIDSPDTRVIGTNLRLQARKDFTMSAKGIGGIVAGILNMASSADFGASVELDKLTSLLKAMKLDEFVGS